MPSNWKDYDIDALSETELRLVRERLLKRIDEVDNNRRAKIERLQADRMAIDRELRRRALPQEPIDRSVITFTRKLGGTEYVYAAVRVGQHWYTTSKADRTTYTWTALMNYIRNSDARFPSLTVMHAARTIDIPPTVRPT